MITLRLRATRAGVVRAELHHGPRFGESTAASAVWLVLDGGRLRQCRGRERERTADSVADSLFGEAIRVELRNDCEEDIELVMLPCEVEDRRPTPRARGWPPARCASGGAPG